MTTVYAAAEVARHDTEKDLWMVIHGGVFDLTRFLQEHPGGEEVLLNLAGQDGTTCFDEIGHSSEAVKLCETYKIGEVTGTFGPKGTSSEGIQDTAIDDDTWEYQEPKYETSRWLPVIIGIGVALYAIIFYYFWFS